MNIDKLVAWAIFLGYFGIIAASFGFVVASIVSGRKASDVLSGRPFVFARTALGGLLCTWYFMLQFMKWSYVSYERNEPGATYGDWLVGTSLFEQAWRAVCVGDAQWWWSSWICTAAILFTAIIWHQCIARGIKYPLAYMIFGQLVAISVAIALFLTAVFMHPPLEPVRKPKATFPLWSTLLAALGVMYVMPQYANTPAFVYARGAIHGAVVLPLLVIPKSTVKAALALPYKVFIPLVLALAGVIHWDNTKRVIDNLPATETSWYEYLGWTIVSHPAQGSVSLDVIWVGITFILWFICYGPTYAVMLKTALAIIVGGVAAARYLGVNWLFIASLVPIAGLLAFAGAAVLLSKAQTGNAAKRAAILGQIGVVEHGVIPGTTTQPPRMAKKRTVVGFWHPFCNSGGGGERVLWTAIAWLQRAHPDVISLVYSGDYPEASKEDILQRVKDRFEIELDGKRLQFVPLPSRYLVSDTYWKRFTLLGQSLGSIYLAWEGLCGKDGAWGDIFIDSMGYAFTLPFVQLLTGGSVAIGTYTHYPTVSSDMVKRVRERKEGVENAGASKSALRTWIKLAYYAIFTRLYAISLLFSEYTMTNSSWTQAHIKSLLTFGRSSFGAGLLLLDDKSQEMREKRGESAPEDRARCEVVFPPCDTKELSTLGQLDQREPTLVSLAQFRPEKDHAKQLHALSILFEEYPQYRQGAKKIHLTLMGGARGPADEGRVAELKELAVQLGIADNVAFLVNAPYPEVVSRLGKATIGLNTMQDEHFGINVVEFMAAGLIPIVHASAGPYLDIVVPYKGQRTGFHATDAKSFAAAIHEALSMSAGQQLAMRKAARALAEDKFSERAFERGFERGWNQLARAAHKRGTEQVQVKY
ncbi:asparagine-linked glycosylation protein [Vanrija albida]|uniref:GDP-Man:Man(3)GlcNAc(2)-PP-Dol alpha-1,2-mannosyltransferase n=1 Tax=Vanrija albida TaxID=181172 RepID=A0ABR3PV61_9TREE